MTDLNIAELRRVAEAATAVVGMAGTLGSGPWVLKGMPDEAIDHINAFDPPTVLRLLDLAQRAEADRAAVERQGLGRLICDALDKHWPNSGVNGWFLADLIRAAFDPKADQ